MTYIITSIVFAAKCIGEENHTEMLKLF